MDNLPAYKVVAVKEVINKSGERLLFLLSYSPDLNPFDECLWMNFEPPNELHD